MSVPELLGSSGGSLCAVGLVLGLDFDDIAKFAFDCVERTHGSYAAAFELRTYAAACIDRQWSKLSAENKLKKQQTKEANQASKAVDNEVDDEEEEENDDDDHLGGSEGVLAGRVTVSVTTLPWLRNKRYNSFDSMEHVKTVLLASCTAVSEYYV